MPEHPPVHHRARRVVVTGGAGFVGSAVVRALLEGRADDRPERVVVLDALTHPGSRANLAACSGDPRLALVVGDVTDAPLVRALLRDEEPDTVLHFAAASPADRSIADPLRFVRTNVLGTATLLDECARAWGGREGRRFHHASTEEVYGELGPDDAGSTETSRYAPSSPYAASMAGADHLVRAWSRTYRFPATITAGSSTYGPGQRVEALVPSAIRACLEGRPVLVPGDGSHVRDWSFVDDHAAGVLSAVRHGRVGTTYNVGGGAEWRTLDLVRLVCRTVADLTGARVDALLASITSTEDPGALDRRSALDTRRLRGFGWSPRVGLAEGLVRTVGAYLERGFG